MRPTGVLASRRPANCQESSLRINLKGKLGIGVSALAVAAFAGGAYAADRDSRATGQQAFLNDAAKRLHVTPQQLSDALTGAAIDQLNAAVAAGRLTKAQAQALKQRIEQAGPGAVPGSPWFFGQRLLRQAGAPGLGAASGGPGGNGSHGAWAPWFGRPRGPASGAQHFWPAPWAVPPGAPKPSLKAPPPAKAPRSQTSPPAGPPRGWPGPGAPPIGFPKDGPMAAAASYLGLSPAQLFEQLRSGKSLADIAKARGKSLSGLKQAIASKLSFGRFAFPTPGKALHHGSWRSAPQGSPRGPAMWAPAAAAGQSD
jgi:hypothetical protein